MLVLKPEIHETIWGGKKLTPLSGSTCEKIGHLYSAYQVRGQSNEILNGDWKGKKFSEYFTENKSKFHLNKFSEFPLVIALVEAADNLSIQVHPDDKMAEKLEGLPFGKNESWYFIDPPVSGRIFNGCLSDSTEALKQAIENNIIESTVDYLTIEKEDYVYITGGTLHALSTGSLVYEIEENAEVTYRFYDFNRIDKDGKLRSLQLGQALECVHVQDKSHKRKYGSTPIEERMYITQKYDNMERYKNNSDTLECLTILEDSIYLADEGMQVMKGQTIVLEPGEKIDEFIKSAIMARPKY